MARGQAAAEAQVEEQEVPVEEMVADDAPYEAPDAAALRREAYSAAQTRLREENRDAYNRIMAEEMRARGIDWAPRLTEEEKAAKQVADLLAQYPSLREQVSTTTE